MKNECYRIFRNYCSLSVDEVAELTGISTNRILMIEHGDAVPSDEECMKFSRIYNISHDKLNCSLSEVFETIVREPIDNSFYNNCIERDLVIEKITSLSVTERTVIMKMRLAEDKDEIFKKIMELLS